MSRFDGWLVEHHDVAAEVVDALDAIARTPYDPPFPTRPYLGDDLTHSFVSSINDDIDLVFKVFRDQPYLGLVSLLDYRDLSSM